MGPAVVALPLFDQYSGTPMQLLKITDGLCCVHSPLRGMVQAGIGVDMDIINRTIYDLL